MTCICHSQSKLMVYLLQPPLEGTASHRELKKKKKTLKLHDELKWAITMDSLILGACFICFFGCTLCLTKYIFFNSEELKRGVITKLISWTKINCFAWYLAFCIRFKFWFTILADCKAFFNLILFFERKQFNKCHNSTESFILVFYSHNAHTSESFRDS